MARFVVKDSVDEEIQRMQDDKAKKIGAAINDPKMLGKLAVDELLRLFGPVVCENGKPIVKMKRSGATKRVPFPHTMRITESEDSE